MIPDFLLPLPFAFVFTGVALQLMLTYADRFLPVDAPNERSLHNRPVPRFGGLAMLIGSALALLLAPGSLAPWLWPVVVLALVSLLDDFVSLSALPRFAVHILTASAFVWGQSVAAAWLPLLVVVIVWMTNLYNFMDGSDGLAGGMALAGFGGYAVLAWIAGDMQVMAVCAAVCGAASAFLLRNLHPASVFMGDVGSIPLGFLAAGIGLVGVQRGLWHSAIPVLMFLVFIADATVTLLQRLRRGERVWQAHRTHYYQRLVRMGLGHARTARLYFSIMMGCALTAVAIQVSAPALAGGALVAWCLVLTLAGRQVDRHWVRHEASMQEAAS
jgi:UDP-N-acetylmuramyl pentapeptide phosphotransferase/UDP-N-acetylglucosamine-1-phosphate transferase